MKPTPVHKRKYHAFLSHAHADKAVVDRLKAWLSDVANIPIWYDATDLPAGARIASYLPKAILDCRAMLIVLSKASVNSGWVEEEYNTAIGQRTQFEQYRIIPVRIEACDVPAFLQSTKWIDLFDHEPSLTNFNELLAAFYYDDFTLDIKYDRTKDIYISRTWRDSESSTADFICRLLAQAGFRLIGDSEDQVGFEEGKRVESIMSSCGGFVAILPDRGDGKTSGYMLKEIELAQNLGLPCVIFAESTVVLPGELAQHTRFFPVSKVEEHEDLFVDGIETLRESWKRPQKPHYIFFGTNLDDIQRNRALQNIIQLVTAMPCIMGDEIREEPIQKVITDRIAQAFMMIADISEDNLNTCIEAGIARGARTKTYLIAAAPRRRPPFMFRDQQVWHYDDSISLLGTIHRIIYPYRRRILNYELSRKPI